MSTDPPGSADDVRCVALIRLNGDRCPRRAEWLTEQGKRLCGDHADLSVWFGAEVTHIDGSEAP
jgi:hypothetical protein